MQVRNLNIPGILKLFLTGAEIFCLGIRNCIILWYRNFLTSWENLHCKN